MENIVCVILHDLQFHFPFLSYLESSLCSSSPLQELKIFIVRLSVHFIFNDPENMIQVMCGTHSPK